MPSPSNLTEPQSFLGMVNYLNRFSPILSQISLPLRQMTKKDVPFMWQPEQQQAFQELKQVITEAPVLSYYNPEKKNLIQSDASLKGIGCVLMQDGKPVCYASRSLSETESRYSNIERELLAACWSLEKFNHYVFGKKVVIETDHKPLESIWKKSITSASPRLQRLLLRMSKYDVDLRYIEGKKNVIADALSRVSCMEPPVDGNEVPMIEINEISSTLPASPTKLDEIREQTRQDATLDHLKEVIHHGWPEYPSQCPSDLKEFWNFREDLSVENGLVLKRHRLVIPSKLRQQMLQIVHQGHMGTEKCLLKAKDCLFWPGISNDIKKMTTTCSTCLQYSKQQSKEPLHPHNVPSFPWQKVGTDLLEYKGAQYLLVADYYSKYPILRKLNGTTSNAVINQLKSIFAEYGIPETLVSDNGPQYSSREFSTFCSHWGIGHSTSSPLYPRSNGFVERMVQTVKNLLCKSEAA
ncbi:retrotransposon-like family member retr-1, partial [Paramuricea clavata]